MTTELWKQLMLQALCSAYKLWGGDCAEFLGTKHAADLVLAAYARDGAPKFNSAQDRDSFLENLSTMKTLLAAPENSLPASQTEELGKMIEDLQQALQ